MVSSSVNSSDFCELIQCVYIYINTIFPASADRSEGSNNRNYRDFLFFCFSKIKLGGRGQLKNTPTGCGSIFCQIKPHSENFFFQTFFDYFLHQLIMSSNQLITSSNQLIMSSNQLIMSSNQLIMSSNQLITSSNHNKSYIEYYIKHKIL